MTKGNRRRKQGMQTARPWLIATRWRPSIWACQQWSKPRGANTANTTQVRLWVFLLLTAGPPSQKKCEPQMIKAQSTHPRAHGCLFREEEPACSMLCIFPAVLAVPFWLGKQSWKPWAETFPILNLFIVLMPWHQGLLWNTALFFLILYSHQRIVLSKS